MTHIAIVINKNIHPQPSSNRSLGPVPPRISHNKFLIISPLQKSLLYIFLTIFKLMDYTRLEPVTEQL